MGVNKAILFQKHEQAEMDATKPGCSSLPLLLVEVQALVVEPGFIPLISYRALCWLADSRKKKHVCVMILLFV